MHITHFVTGVLTGVFITLAAMEMFIEAKERKSNILQCIVTSITKR